ncbi:TPA: hypothetical protein P0E30_003740 [Vibrio harveyi]|nr:hypothetical protein [Vibrio harveyi]
MNFNQAVAALKQFEYSDLYDFGNKNEKAILEQVMIIGSAGAKEIAKDLLTNDFENYPDSFYMVAMLQSDADLQVWIDAHGKRKVISFAKAWDQAVKEVKRLEALKVEEASSEASTPEQDNNGAKTVKALNKKHQRKVDTFLRHNAKYDDLVNKCMEDSDSAYNAYDKALDVWCELPKREQQNIAKQIPNVKGCY